jgi:hypothetical protein
MRYTRVCPLCGGAVVQRNGCGSKTPEAVRYGTMLSMDLACDNPACDFSLAFPFDAELYVRHVTEVLRARTRALLPDRRVTEMLDALANCKKNEDDPLSERIFDGINGLFMEALGEILKDTRQMLRALSFREPNAEIRKKTREELQVFLRFLSRMEGHYPTPRLESEFKALEEGLKALDYRYELGMLMLDTDPARARELFLQGKEAGEIRSRVAYVKYILASDEEQDLRAEFLRLAPYSQEAVDECIRRTAVGKESLLLPLNAYLETSYPQIFFDGKLTFLCLILNAGIDCCEPTLRQSPIFSTGEAIDADAWETSRNVLSEMDALAVILTDRCAELRAAITDLESETGEGGEIDAIRAEADEIDALTEYLIGCCMYYRSRMDFEKRFDDRYLREAVGHFFAFLESPLMRVSSAGALDIPSLIGFRNLRALYGRAEQYLSELEDAEQVRRIGFDTP